jgi:hypothetical protein
MIASYFVETEIPENVSLENWELKNIIYNFAWNYFFKQSMIKKYWKGPFTIFRVTLSAYLRAVEWGTGNYFPPFNILKII